MLCLFGGEYLIVSILIFYMNLCSCGMLRPSKLVDPFVNKTKVESYNFLSQQATREKNLRKTQKSLPKHPKNMVPGCFFWQTGNTRRFPNPPDARERHHRWVRLRRSPEPLGQRALGGALGAHAGVGCISRPGQGVEGLGSGKYHFEMGIGLSATEP